MVDSGSKNLLQRSAIDDSDKKNILLKEMDLLQKVFDKYDGWIFRLRAGCVTAVAALVSLRIQQPPLATLAFLLVIMAFFLEGLIRWDHWYGYVERYNVIRRFLNGLDGDSLYIYDLKNYKAGDKRSFRSLFSSESVKSCFFKKEVIVFYLFVIIFWGVLLWLVRK